MKKKFACLTIWLDEDGDPKMIVNCGLREEVESAEKTHQHWMAKYPEYTFWTIVIDLEKGDTILEITQNQRQKQRQ